MGATGTLTVDFGATPAVSATGTVTGQASILTTSLAEAWVMGATTADHNENSHLMLAVLSRCTCGIPTAGNGFPITVDLMDGLLTGQVKIQWVWN